MSQKLGDAPIEQKYIDQMNAVARALDETFNPKTFIVRERGKPAEREVGFVLLVFEYGEKEGRCNFISNGADRKDVVALFREMIARFEGQPEMKGRA
jgi:hypothetical protein